MDGQTERCAHCGTPSVDGARFCTNCGAQLGTEPTNPRIFPSSDDTAERTYGVSPPTYAASQSAASAPVPGLAPARAESVAPTHLGPGLALQRKAGAGLWVAMVAAMFVVLILGGILLLNGGGGGAHTASPTTPDTSNPDSGSSGSSGEPTPTEPASSSPAIQVKGPPTNVAGFARASAPRHAPAGVDFGGHPVTYVAANLVDGRNDTCWRVAGDASGTVLTFRLDQPTRLTRVGLVNGYAKIAYAGKRPFDWYRGNRRVLSAQWLFDEGHSVTQRFRADRGMQQTAIKPVTTSSVRLRITSVSPPGKGRAARNDTAISEVLLLGRTG